MILASRPRLHRGGGSFLWLSFRLRLQSPALVREGRSLVPADASALPHPAPSNRHSGEAPRPPRQQSANRFPRRALVSVGKHLAECPCERVAQEFGTGMP